MLAKDKEIMAYTSGVSQNMSLGVKVVLKSVSATFSAMIVITVCPYFSPSIQHKAGFFFFMYPVSITEPCI